MALSITNDFTTLYTGDVSFAGNDVLTGFQRFGSGCNGGQVSNGTGNFFETVPSYSLVGRQIFSWMVGPGSIATIAQGGYRIVIGDGTNTRSYFVGGRDSKNFQSEGWFCFILNGDNLPTQFDQLSGTVEPNLSALTQVGCGFTTTSKAVGNSPNVFYDVTRVGTGLTITGGDVNAPGTFQEIYNTDSLITNAWGVIEQLGEGVFGVQGKLNFGSGTTSVYFQDFGATIVYTNRPVGVNFLTFILQGSSASTFILGEELQTGTEIVGLNGCTFISANTNVAFNFNPTSFTDIKILACNFSSLGSVDFILSGDNTHLFISNNVTNSGMIVSNSMFIRNLFSINTNSINSSFLWNDNTDIKNSTFIGNSSAILFNTLTNTTVSFDNLTFTGNTFDITNTTGVEVIVNSVNGSNATTSTGDLVTINNPITFKVTGLVTDSEVRIFRSDNRVELAGVESSTTEFTYDYNFGGNITAYLVVHKQNYEYLKIDNIILGDTNQTITVQQRFDRNYSSA